MALASGTSKVAIVSQAFSFIGNTSPINDLEGGNPQVTAASEIYDTMLLDILTCAPWRFAMRTVELNQLTAAPLNTAWRFAYQLPLGYLTMYRIWPQGLKGGWQDFRIYEDQIWTNLSTKLFADYLFNPGEENFPAYFVQALIFRLASLISVPIAQNVELAEFWEQKAMTQIEQAKGRDAKAFPNPWVQQNEIYAAHFSL